MKDKKAEIKITVLNDAETGHGANVEIHGVPTDIIYGMARGAAQICKMLDVPLETYLTACRLAKVLKPGREATVDLNAVRRGSRKEDQP